MDDSTKATHCCNGLTIEQRLRIIESLKDDETMISYLEVCMFLAELYGDNRAIEQRLRIVESLKDDKTMVNHLEVGIFLAELYGDNSLLLAVAKHIIRARKPAI